MSARIKLALIDDDPAVLDSTGLLLKGLGLYVHAFPSADEFLAEIAKTRMDLSCIVSDVRMPGTSGLELQEALARQGNCTPLILITGHGDVRMAVAAIKAGAHEFIEKPFSIDDLAAAIRSAAETASEAAAEHKERNAIAARAEQLSARQREVMDLVVEGYSSKQIGAKLGISPRTVETYRLLIMEKMGAGSVAALVRMAAAIEGRSERG
jgi:two-component system response regulator FixJ